ncbi:DUF3298 and DUF4163 domain-containing protein [Hymenobacter swuensis]|uniref:DUF3298 domain-containing protein n=1 Tax=Hymenobacter swuensis DY53 TaxID=1227739 RepID=W8F190_9BACT|nr:DUF3298 and DUF4163 domain-containing protein [Hymenobacter swuensis]AHJ98668.1 hypothetical protein Hsw_3073 [Hymenobacter swuensis DY53]
MSFLSQSRPARLLRLLPAPLALGLLLTACNSGSDKSAADTSDAAVTAAPVVALTDSASWYQQFRGVLPGSTDSITVHLQRVNEVPGENTLGRLVGFYAAADGHPYELTGDVSPTTDSLRLRDTSHELLNDQNVGPQWLLKQEGSALVGTRAGQPVRLRLLRQPVGVRFSTRTFAAAVLPRPESPQDSVFGQLSMFALVPESGASKDKLAANLARGLRGDSLESKPALSLDALWDEQLAYFTKEYRKEVAPMVSKVLADSTDDYQPLATLSYEQEANTYVLWNEGDLLSIGYFGYDFSGGAHGIYGTYVRSYDTRTGRALGYNDIFKPGTRPQLEGILGRYARPALGLKDGASMAGKLFKNSLPATRNVYLTSGGAVFVYLPYEVASYAQGEISVFVPYSALQAVLKPGLPISSGQAVARN